jgi:hypothetical protein
MAKCVTTKGKKKGPRTKKGLAAISKAAKKRTGAKNPNFNPFKSRDGITKATKEELEKFAARQRDHEYPKPWFMRPDEVALGKPKAFQSPEHLHLAAQEYFQWCEDHPWHRAEWKDKGLQSIPVKRVFTWEGLCLRLGVGEEYFRNFLKQLKPDDPELENYRWVTENIRKTIYSNKFEGASGGFYNANLISYDLGLRKDIPTSGLGAGITIVVSESHSGKLLEDVKAALNKVDNEHTPE